VDVPIASKSTASKLTVLDLFSGAGGASYGFHAHPDFEIVGAADMELGKPSSGKGTLGCNKIYQANIGIKPATVDLGAIKSPDLAEAINLRATVNVLVASPPCTGFSRIIAKNHVRDDPRNTLVSRIAEFVAEFDPNVVFIENARELVKGKFDHHFRRMSAQLEALGYRVRADIYMLQGFGLPQRRQRSLIVGTKRDLPISGLHHLWRGHLVDEKATHVRRAIWDLPAIESGEIHSDDAAHTSTLSEGLSLQRIKAIPKNGGSWADLLESDSTRSYLTPAMRRAATQGRLNSFCDVYGRMSWDRPAPTIKRECSHLGNGRYLHPDQDRLCSVREMAILQGFPRAFRFPIDSRKNAYRTVGDAVPPLISYQMAHLAAWILTGRRPDVREILLSGTHLSEEDVLVGDDDPRSSALYRSRP
jgi:DNA (cytosine-5)-methyltransferase 1